MAAAVYHWNWSRTSYRELACSLLAGHFIECSCYVTGVNFTGFKSLPQGVMPLFNLPVTTINQDGSFFVGLHETPGRSGQASIDRCRSQLLYEIHGKRYYNSDVGTIIDQIKLEQATPTWYMPAILGVDKPPATTKVGITAKGGYQTETPYCVVELDAVENVQLLERQLRHYLDTDSMSLLKFTTSGVASTNLNFQDEATLDVRIFAEAATEEALSPAKFLRPCWNVVIMTFPGGKFALDARQGAPRGPLSDPWEGPPPYLEYFVTTLPLSPINHVAHLPYLSKSIPIAQPEDTTPYVFEQEVSETTDARPLSDFGPTVTAPLGYIVHARSGDKESDCNVGFYVRNADKYPWLQSRPALC